MQWMAKTFVQNFVQKTFLFGRRILVGGATGPPTFQGPFLDGLPNTPEPWFDVQKNL